MTTSSFFNFSLPTASSICQTFFESKTCVDIQEQFSHFFGKVKQIDFNTFFNFALPITVAAFSIYKSFPLLFGAMRGYDSEKKRVEFKNRATGGLNKENQKIPLSERVSYLKRYAFGSISIKDRLLLTAKALGWLALGALAMAPLFKKNVNANNVPIPSTIVDPNQLQATINGKEKEYYLGRLAILERPIYASDLNSDRINPQLQTILTAALAPSEKSSLFEKAREYFGYSNQTSFPLFTEFDGRTIVNGTVLEQQCNTTLPQINQLVPMDFKETLANGMGSVCNSTIGYFSSPLCQNLKDWLTPFQNTTTSGIAKQRLESACAFLRERASSDAIFANILPFLNGMKEFLNPDKLIGQGQGASTLIDSNFAKVAEFFNNQENLKRLCTKDELIDKCKDMTETFLNISINDTKNSKLFKAAYRAFSLNAHPDKCSQDLKSMCGNIFGIGSQLKDMISEPQFNATITSPNKPSAWYTPFELGQRFAQWYQTPIPPSQPTQ